MAPAVLAMLGSSACGVEEHLRNGAPAPADSSNDFGPQTGTGAVGGTPVAGAGGFVASNGGTGVQPPGAGGFVQGAGGFVQGAGGFAQGAGGLIPGGGGVAPGMGGVPVQGGGGAAPAAGGAPPSGVTITLGTQTVAKEDAIAFIHFGHSNMAGRAIGPTATRPYFFMESDPHAWMYHVGTPPQPALEPFTADDNTMGTYGGPGTAIVKEAAALAPSKQFISLGFGKESAYCSQFLPGALWYDSVMKAPLAIKDHVTFGAIVVMLGITERHGTTADITGYPDCINKLVTQIRTDIGRPDLPLLITDYEQEATGPLAVGQSFPNSIIPQIRMIPTIVSNSALVPTDGLGMQDDHHFNFDGHKLWVQRMLQIMKDKGWFPWN
jgi:hypothetical protein